ncbi:MAG: asparagine synthetase B [Clostridia bacterium]|nr:asparagine synthetase B [Clostridia bacterium]
MTKINSYRGHIRNWEQLCDELSIDKNLSREDREKEILIKGYDKWNVNLPDHLYGMFAFSLEDEENDLIYCCRDHFGAKPFYYYVTDDKKLLCSTMIRDILDMPGFVKELNEDMLQIYLTLTYVAGRHTFFKGLEKLLPGEYMIFKNGEAKITKYWKPTFKIDETKSLDDFADEIHETVKQMFKEVKTDDEVATSFLSGGVDSAYVIAMSDVKEASCCGYEEEKFDESPFAKETADYCKRDFNRCVITPEEYFDIVPFVMYNMELPLGDASAIAFTLGCKKTAEKYKLCYSGEGSDEFFGGYNMYRNAERYGENLKTFYVGNTNVMKEEDKMALLNNYNENIKPIDLVKDLYDDMEGLDPLTKMCNVDINIWLEGDIYLNVDKMSTAFGLEIRMPLTDRRVFDIASRMPAKYKVNETQNKVAFRTAASKVLPEDIAFRKKLGFVVPIRMWLADPKYNKHVVETLHSDSAKKFFKQEEIDRIFDTYVNVNSDEWRKVWTIYTFLVWYEEYFVKR